jgi:hypothetical protein
MSDEFSWSDTDSVVVRQQDAIAIYSNPNDDLVVRRRQAWNLERRRRRLDCHFKNSGAHGDRCDGTSLEAD